MTVSSHGHAYHTYYLGASGSVFGLFVVSVMDKLALQGGV